MHSQVLGCLRRAGFVAQACDCLCMRLFYSPRPPCEQQAACRRPPLPPPQAERLAQRLQAICGEEGLRAEKSTLRLLVERTDCDIRSCLNTLQVQHIIQVVMGQYRVHCDRQYLQRVQAGPPCPPCVAAQARGRAAPQHAAAVAQASSTSLLFNKPSSACIHGPAP